MRWFRDFALEKRISHIIHCAERSEWPVGKSYSAYTGCQGMDLDIPLFETVKHVASDASGIRGNSSSSASSSSMMAHGSGSGSASHAPDVITITTDQGGLSKQLSAQMNAAAAAAQAVSQQLAAAVAAGGGGGGGGSAGPGGSTSKKRKRHIAIDVETERAKLHALLNSTQGNYVLSVDMICTIAGFVNTDVILFGCCSLCWFVLELMVPVVLCLHFFIFICYACLRLNVCS